MAETVETDQPLSPSGRLFLQPLMNQVINCAVAVEHPFAVDSLQIELQNSIMLTHPRFCSLMVRDSCGREHWRRTQVDVDRHLIIRHRPLSDDPSVSDEDAVNDYIADLSLSSPLPTDKPLWEIHVLVPHKTAVFRVHHALGDGISLMSMLLSSCRRANDPDRPPGVGVVGAAARRWSVWTVAKVVWFTLVYVLEFLMSVLWMRDKTTAVSGGAGVELWPRRLATARFRLHDMKAVKRAVAGSTINDVLFGVISSGLSRYLDMRSPKALREGDQITGVAMVNLRPQQGLQAITMHMLSYAGIADMQILVAKDIIPYPKVLAKCFEDALSEMKQAAEDVLKS